MGEQCSGPPSGSTNFPGSLLPGFFYVYDLMFATDARKSKSDDNLWSVYTEPINLKQAIHCTLTLAAPIPDDLVSKGLMLNDAHHPGFSGLWQLFY